MAIQYWLKQLKPFWITLAITATALFVFATSCLDIGGAGTCKPLFDYPEWLLASTLILVGLSVFILPIILIMNIIVIYKIRK